MSGDVKTLAGVKVGDQFMRCQGGWDDYLEAVVCEAVTAKQCVIGGVRYRIGDALELGGGGFRPRGDLQHFDEAEFRESERTRHLAKIRNHLRVFRWKDIPDDKIEQVWEIVKPLPTPKPSGTSPAC